MSGSWMRGFSLAALLAAFLAAPAAAAPALSRGEQYLGISMAECLSRAEAALAAEGYAAWGSAPSNGRWGAKGIHSAVVLCNDARDGQQVVNIVVASESGDGNVPGAERVRLQQRMEGATSNCSGRLVAVEVRGDGLLVSWQGLPGNPQDWLALAVAGAAPNSHGDWFYTESARSGSKLRARPQPGDYELRVFFNWPAGEYKVQDCVRFRVQ